MADTPRTDRRAGVRVAIVSSVHRWNDTRVFVKQATSLAANGYDVTLAAIGDQPAPFDAGAVRVVPLRRRPRAWRWLTWLSILRLVLKERASIVHAHDPELFPLMVLLRLTGRRVVCDVHENIAQQVLHKEWIPAGLRGIFSAVLTVLQRALPTAANAVILAEDSYSADFPAADNVTIVRNFPLLPDQHKTDYASDVFRMIYVGDVRLVRGIGECVAIAARLAKQGIPVELRVVGSFADRAEERQIHDTVRQLGIEKQVVFLGRRPPEEIPELVTQCDVGLALLHPIGNYRESYPTKMFEYMAAGLPVVASRFDLWERVLVGNDCGRVVDPCDVEEAAQAVLDYCGSQELRERHGRNGRRAVVERYQWSRELPQLLAIYAPWSRTASIAAAQSKRLAN